jgi:hypothetical protein
MREVADTPGPFAIGREVRIFTRSMSDYLKLGDRRRILTWQLLNRRSEFV